MTSPAQPDPQVEVDLTALPVESTPGEEGRGRGIQAKFGLSLFWKAIRIVLRVNDSTAQLAKGLYFLIITLAVMIPALVTLAICEVAGAPTVVTVIASLGTAVIFLAIALLHGYLRRRD
jgi:hypothetical protein